jgi:hypothetical protein
VKRLALLRARRADLRADANMRRVARFDALVAEASTELSTDLAHVQRLQRLVWLLTGAIVRHADEARA